MRNLKPDVIAAVAAVFSAPYPCEECPRQRACGTRFLACQSFASYVTGDTTWRQKDRESPTRELYARCHPRVDQPELFRTLPAAVVAYESRDFVTVANPRNAEDFPALWTLRRVSQAGLVQHIVITHNPKSGFFVATEY